MQATRQQLQARIDEARRRAQVVRELAGDQTVYVADKLVDWVLAGLDPDHARTRSLHIVGQVVLRSAVIESKNE